MPSIPLTMLWEATDAEAALSQRFGFTTPSAAAQWLLAQVSIHYGLAVATVHRMVISSHNLLVWLNTPDGQLLAKCCAAVQLHPQLQQLGALILWLEEQGLPVSPPLLAKDGTPQVRCDHLSLHVQRIIPGTLLDPTELIQAQAAGIVFAQLHQALARYPQAAVMRSREAPTPATLVRDWQPPALEAHLSALLVTVREQASAFAPIDLSAQLIHLDYRAANLLWHDGQIAAVLDFENLAWGYALNDLAWGCIHLGTRFHHWRPVSTAVHSTFLAGYELVQPLSNPERAWLRILIAFYSIRVAQSSVGGITATDWSEAAAAAVALLEPNRKS